MRKILILGSGEGGTIVANMLRKELVGSEWGITIINRQVETDTGGQYNCHGLLLSQTKPGIKGE